MKIREVLSPTAGLFSAMPQDVWGEDLDPTHLDIELFTRIGGLDAAPLFRHFVENDVLDTHGLAQLLHQRYASNWKHVWDALKADYDVFITSMNDETRTVTRDRKDLETRALQDQITEAGADSTVDTFNEKNATDSTVTKTGAENRSVAEDETRTGGTTDTGTTSTDRTADHRGSATTERTEDHTGTGGTESSKTHNGSSSSDRAEHHTGTGTTTDDKALYGMGAQQGVPVPASKDTLGETRNFSDSTLAIESDTADDTENSTETRNFSDVIQGADSDTSNETENATETRNLKGTSTAEANVNTSDRLEFEDRADHTDEETSHTGTVDRTTNYGKRTDVGKTGTVDTLGSELEKETFHSEGSSPLRTFQALIQEELDGRTGQSWNFTELVIRDVQAMIASMIWRRNRG